MHLFAAAIRHPDEPLRQGLVERFGEADPQWGAGSGFRSLNRPPGGIERIAIRRSNPEADSAMRNSPRPPAVPLQRPSPPAPAATPAPTVAP